MPIQPTHAGRRNRRILTDEMRQLVDAAIRVTLLVVRDAHDENSCPALGHSSIGELNPSEAVCVFEAWNAWARAWLDGVDQTADSTCDPGYFMEGRGLPWQADASAKLAHDTLQPGRYPYICSDENILARAQRIIASHPDGERFASMPPREWQKKYPVCPKCGFGVKLFRRKYTDYRCVKCGHCWARSLYASNACTV